MGFFYPIDFKYNHNGLRTQKKVVENGITTIYDYTLHGKLITHLTKRVVNSQNVETDREELHFFYDSQSRPAFVECDNAMYRYVHNLQGDIVAILDAAGNPVVEYKYDAWGKLSSAIPETGIGATSPFRYRNNIYDAEIELYYLSSRYYSYELGRFINPDALLTSCILGENVWTYCWNDPIFYSDKSGLSPQCATCKNQKVLDEAYSEYEKVRHVNFGQDMIEQGRFPQGEIVEINASVKSVYNSTKYEIADAMSFLGFTGVSDIIAGAINMGLLYFGIKPINGLDTAISNIIGFVGMSIEKTVASMDNGMHKQYTIALEVYREVDDATIYCEYKFDEGDHFDAVSISGLYMPKNNPRGTVVFRDSI